MEAISYSHSSSSTGECTHAPITKKKRTQRPKSTPIATSSNSEVDDIISSTTTEEDEDMARCLILLAQGQTFNQHATSGVVEKDGVYVYECKTCSRSFTSFQALGGHRASHKKPKMETTATTAVADQEDRKDTFDFHMIKNNNNNNSKKMRVHECSICGAEFSSGQALGGHMRRHRQIISSEKLNVTQEVAIKKEEEKRVFSLDLNLPAPSDENPTAMGFLLGDQRSTVFSSPLIDCHY